MNEPLTRSLDEPEPPNGPTHVDDFICEIGADADRAYAQWVLLHFRQPAALRWKFERFMKPHELYCDWQGQTYRVIGASRLGDVWLSRDFSGLAGYEHRVSVDDCSGWRATPNGKAAP